MNSFCLSLYCHCVSCTICDIWHYQIINNNQKKRKRTLDEKKTYYSNSFTREMRKKEKRKILMKERRAFIIAFCVLSEYYSILFLYFIVIIKYNNLIIIQKREMFFIVVVAYDCTEFIWFFILFHHLSLCLSKFLFPQLLHITASLNLSWNNKSSCQDNVIYVRLNFFSTWNCWAKV